MKRTSNWKYWLIAIPIYVTNGFVITLWLHLPVWAIIIEAVAIGVIVPIVLEKFNIYLFKN